MRKIQFDQLSLFSDRLILDSYTAEWVVKSPIVLTGPSGCGKSTLLRILARLELAKSGNFAFENISQALWLAQTPAFRGETMHSYFSLSPQPLSTDLLEIFQLQWDPSKKCASLSGGEQRRLALLRLCLHQPDLLLLDEWSNGLDNHSFQTISSYLLDNHPAIISVSHDQRWIDLCSQHYTWQGSELQEVLCK